MLKIFSVYNSTEIYFGFCECMVANTKFYYGTHFMEINFGKAVKVFNAGKKPDYGMLFCGALKSVCPLKILSMMVLIG